MDRSTFSTKHSLQNIFIEHYAKMRFVDFETAAHMWVAEGFAAAFHKVFTYKPSCLMTLIEMGESKTHPKLHDRARAIYRACPKLFAISINELKQKASAL